MNVLASFIQGCSGEVVEHLLHNLKVGGLRPPCAQLLFRYTAGKFRWRIKLNRKFRSTWQKKFLLYVWHPVWVAENHIKPCNSTGPAPVSIQGMEARITGNISHTLWGSFVLAL
jgi:hypothetical protein